MPVSPRDFELYSRMTGASMPTDAVSRARMAPDVYDFTRNFAKSPNILDKAGDMVKGIGRTFQRGIGAGIQADLSGAKSPYTTTNQRSGGKTTKSEGKTTTTGDGESEPAAIMFDGTKLYSAGEGSTPHRPTSGNYGQRVNENQTNVGLEERKGTQGMEIISGPSTVAEEISGSQSSNPDMTSVDRDVKREVQAVAGSVPLTTKEMLQGGGSDNMFTRNLEKTIAGDGMKEIGEVDGGKAKLAEFTKRTGLIPGLVDPDLESAVGQRDQFEEKFGYKGYLPSFDDHTQMVGGEDNNRALSQPFINEIEEIKVDPTPQSNSFVNPTIKNADDFVSMVEEMKGIEASPLRSDIQVGGLQRTAKDGSKELGKSVGMSLMPGTLNGGDAVAFSFMEDPTKPDEVTTRTYSVTPETMQQLQSGEGDVGSMSFGQKMNKAIRGKEGFGSIDKSRFAGDVFITPSL